MRRIQDPTAVATPPALPSIGGPTGYFTGGDPGASVPATRVRAWWLNMMQEEMFAFLTRAGLVADGASNAQVLAAALGMFGGGRRFYIGATQTIVAPAWATKVHLRMWAAGGGGGACTGSFSGGAGGGGGEFREGELPVTGGASYLATVGAGGAGGTGFGNGGGGGNSGFGSLMTAIAGGGGSGSNGTFASVSGTPGSGGGGGTFAILPGPAGTPFAIGANTVPGLGGAAFCTSMNALTVTNANTNGLPGIFPAGGGNGGSNGGAGGIGAAGFIIGEWLP